jgi:hypothetical protein
MRYFISIGFGIAMNVTPFILCADSFTEPSPYYEEEIVDSLISVKTKNTPAPAQPKAVLAQPPAVLASEPPKAMSSSESSKKTSEKKKPATVVFDLALLSGFRQDSLHFNLTSPGAHPVHTSQHSTASLWQNNFVLTSTIHGCGYLTLMGGYGLLTVNKTHYNPPVGSNTFTNTSGYAADGTIFLGCYSELGDPRFLAAPEIGYDYKRIKANEAFLQSLNAPYIGLRLDGQLMKKYDLRLNIYFDWYFNLFHSNDNQLLSSVSTAYSKATGFNYKTGALLNWKPSKHWVVGFKYQFFYAKLGTSLVPIPRTPFIGSERMKWCSQEAQVVLDYQF